MSKKLLIGCGAAFAVVACIVVLVAVFAVGTDDQPPAVAEATAVVATPTPLPDTPLPPSPEDTPVPPTPTDTPAPPTPAPRPALEFGSDFTYMDDIGWQHIVGEVYNVGDKPLSFVRIVAALYDDAGGLITSDFTYTQLDVIPPGGKSPYSLAGEWENVASYELQAEWTTGGDLPRQDLVLGNDSSYVDDIGWWHVVGEVENSGDIPAEFVQVICTMYNADGNVVGTDFTYTDLDTIPAGGKSTFNLAMQYVFDVVSYELLVQGD